MKSYEQQIEEITDEFDFDKVELVMQFLKWKWCDAEEGVPRVGELRKYARRLLGDVSKEEGIKLACGGFLAENNGGYLTLRFVLTEWWIEPGL